MQLAVTSDPNVILAYTAEEIGEEFAVDMSFVELHNKLLSNRLGPPLAEAEFRAWASTDDTGLPLRFNEVVGYDVPLALGGLEGPENQKRIDFEVYWELSGQVGAAISDMEKGTVVDSVQIGDGEDP